jgi:cytochrome c oxidase subunit 1
MLGFLLFFGQLIFLWNFFRSIRSGAVAEQNPWNAATLEWTAPSPAGHGNWEGEIPEVHRWPYDYSIPGQPTDCTGQHIPAAQAPVTD